jgi:colanic acid biosynthesis glycosyl transferase WcaI
MRVLLLSQWFPPEPECKVINLAKGLARHGHEPVVLTGFPNYPGGRLYPGYPLSLRREELIEGIRVVRVPLVPSHSRSVVGRVANYASFGLSSAVAALTSRFHPDVAYVYHPPLTVGLSATLARLLRGTPFVYDVQDLWPDTLSATRMVSSPAAIAAVGHCCRLVYRYASKIAVQSPGFRQALIERGVDPGKIEVILNWCDESVLSAPASASARLGSPDRFQLLFAGNVGRAQGLDVLLHAAQILQARGERIDIHLLGDGVALEELRLKASRLRIENVHFIPRVPMSDAARFLGAADALFVGLRDDPLFSITIPSKTQAYMFMAKPIVLAGRGDVADLVRSAGCGAICDPEDPAALAACIARMASLPRPDRLAMGIAGRSFYARELSIDRGVGRIEGLLRAAADSRRI